MRIPKYGSKKCGGGKMLKYEEATMEILIWKEYDIVRTSFETNDNTGDGNWDDGLPQL